MNKSSFNERAGEGCVYIGELILQHRGKYKCEQKSKRDMQY